MGETYSAGTWKISKNDETATEWYRKAALQGDPEGEYRLGLCYASGLGVPKNEAVAAKINKLRLNLKLETGETGKAFGSITAADLLTRLMEEIKDLVLPKHSIVLDRPLKESGEHQIPVKIHSEVTATLRIEIAAAPKVEQPADEEEAGTRRPRRKSAAASESAEA